MKNIRTSRAFSQFGGRSFIPIAFPLPPRGGMLPPEPGSHPEEEPFEIPTEPRTPPPQRLIPGCYRITFTPDDFSNIFYGTLRVELPGDPVIEPEVFGNEYIFRDPFLRFETVISGDLYRFPRFAFDPPDPTIRPGPGRPRPHFPSPLDIPVYPCSRYHSYLKVTDLVIHTHGWFTLEIEEYNYIQPSPGFFDGTFSDTPDRRFRVRLGRAPAPPGFIGSYFAGRVLGPATGGQFTMGWVTPYFRRATLEIDTVEGAVPPGRGETGVRGRPLPGSRLPPAVQDFRTIFATAGWNLNVFYEDTEIPIPEGVDPNACWTRGALHGLMQSVRRPTVDLDREWWLHLVVVPGTLGCGRGIMYDIIGVPREGVATFSDDGYSRSESLNFGSAEDRKQREVPRAYLRSAAHEVGHGFNQIHQQAEGGPDNSIMTVTPSVADVLGGPMTGSPGVFPDDIRLSFNNTVRRHMIHLPDPVVRPGCMTFASWFGWRSPGGFGPIVPHADQDIILLPQDDLELRLLPKADRLKLGEPLLLGWQLVNQSNTSIPMPNDIRVEALHTHISVIGPDGMSCPVPTFIIECEAAHVHNLEPGEKLEAETWLFWSSQGFSFEEPGKHIIEVRIIWNYSGIPSGVKASTNLWVDYPVNDDDNQVASLLLHNEVGMYVALGGDAPHLKEAVSRIEQTISKYPNHPASKILADFVEPKQSNIGDEQKQ